MMMSIRIDKYFEAGALFTLIITTTIAYTQTTNLNINTETILRLDDILLLITIPAYFVEFIFSVVPAYKNGAILQVYIAFLRIIEVIVQTIFIIDGQRRYMKRKCMQNKHPGRQIVIFLAIGI